MTSVPRIPIARRGLGLILVSPSGAGKTTLTRLLVGAQEIELSVSVTTRQRRASEVEGVHYRFVSVREFESLRDRGDLLEWAEVHGNFYGTPRAPAEAALQAGRDMLFDIDWQGSLQVKEKMGFDVATVFVLPPSMSELANRLRRRAEDSPEVIARRLKNAETEIAEWRRFDYVIVNDDLDAAHADISAILRSERLKRERRTGLGAFVETLLG
jgi:guanylate kinase